MKQQADAYGVFVRAGAITPQIEDERVFRDKAGLPGLSKAVEEAWSSDGNVRRPITLKAGDAFEAEQNIIAEQEDQ